MAAAIAYELELRRTSAIAEERHGWDVKRFLLTYGRLLLPIVPSGLMGAAVLAQARAPSLDSISYEDFKKLDRSAQLQVFNLVSDERKAGLVKQHISQWKDSNRDRLNGEQLALLDEAIELLDSEVYKRPRDANKEAQVKDLEERADRLFSAADQAAAFRLVGFSAVVPDNTERPQE